MENGKSLIDLIQPHLEEQKQIWYRLNHLLAKESERLGRKLEWEDYLRLINNKNSIDLEDKSNGE